MSSESTFKRRRLSPPPAQTAYSLDDEDNAPAYVPVKKRREALLTKLASKHVGGAQIADQQRLEEEAEREEREREEKEGKKQRTAQTLLQEAQEVKRLKAIAGE